MRPTDIMISRGDSSKAERLLGWRAQYKMRDIVKMMLEKRININS